MTANGPISRRDSLKRIALGGAAIGTTGVVAGTGSVAAQELDLAEITVVRLCVDDEENVGWFRVDNDNDVGFQASYAVADTDFENGLWVPANGTSYMSVPTDDDGHALVQLFYEGDLVAEFETRSDIDCDEVFDPTDIELEALCYTPAGELDDDEAVGVFALRNHWEEPVQVTYRAPDREQYGIRYLPAESETSILLGLGATPEPATVTVFLDGAGVAQATAETELVCEIDD